MQHQRGEYPYRHGEDGHAGRKHEGAWHYVVDARLTKVPFPSETTAEPSWLIFCLPGVEKSVFAAPKMNQGSESKTQQCVCTDNELLRHRTDRRGRLLLESFKKRADDMQCRWEHQMRVCFRALLKEIKDSPEKYPIVLSSLMLPRPGASEEQMHETVTGFKQFIGTGNIVNRKGEEEQDFPKFESTHVIVVLPNWDDYRASVADGGVSSMDLVDTVCVEDRKCYYRVFQHLADELECPCLTTIQAAMDFVKDATLSSASSPMCCD